MSSAGFHPLDVPRLRRAAKKLAHADPALADVLQTHGPPPLWKRPATFATFVRIILEQQVSLDSAKSVFDRLAKRCGRPVTAAGILVLGQGRLRELGVTRQKTRYIIALASDVRDRRFRIGSLRHLGNQQQRNQITSRLGLGRWSADIFQLMALCHPDVLPVGDLALVKGMRDLDGGAYQTEQDVIDRAQHWRPYRSVATRMIWQLYLHRRGRRAP